MHLIEFKNVILLNCEITFDKFRFERKNLHADKINNKNNFLQYSPK